MWFNQSSCSLLRGAESLKIVQASGQYLYDEGGNKYLDCSNNACHVGHCHPKVVQAGSDQIRRLSTVSRFLYDGLVLLAERLLATLPPSLSIVYLTNSGSEANDLALRLAFHHSNSTEIIALDRAYHGHVISLINISSCSQDVKSNTLQKQPDFVHVVPCPDAYRGKFRYGDDQPEDVQLGVKYALEVDRVIKDLQTKGKGVGCFIAESMQSRGGQIVFPEGYLQHVYKSVHAAGGVCIADELEVGFGRIGTHMWSFEADGVLPDIVSVGSYLGNGHPIAAVVTTADIAASDNACDIEYINTCGGNPVSCAMGLAVLDVMQEEGLMQHANHIGTHMKETLLELKQKHPIIGDVRGRGLFLGVDLVKDRKSREPHSEAATLTMTKLREEGILLTLGGPYNNVLMIKPPMCFSLENVDTVISKLDAIFSAMKKEKATNST